MSIQRRASCPPSVGRALAKSAQSELYRQVTPLSRSEKGQAFSVPSTSRLGKAHTVVLWPRQSPQQPAWLRYSCSCEAGAAGMPACVHRAAVFQHLCGQLWGVLPAGQQSLTAQAQAGSRDA